MSGSNVEFGESEPDRAVSAPFCANGFGTNELDLINGYRCVKVPMALDRSVFSSMVDTYSESSQFDRYAKFFFCLTSRRFVH